MPIRPATPADAAPIAALVQAVWVLTYATEGVTPAIAAYVRDEFTPTRIATELARPGRRAWVATDGEGIVGFADLEPDRTTASLGSVRQAEVLHLYVHERHVRRGIGSRLLATCCAAAFELGCAVWLSVWERNERAIRFYEALGWERCGDTAFRLGGVAHANRVYAFRKPVRG